VEWVARKHHAGSNDCPTALTSYESVNPTPAAESTRSVSS